MNTTFPRTLTSSVRETAKAAFVLEPPRHSPDPPVVLTTGKYIIGSAADCQIVLSADGLLPHHALLIVGEHKTLLKAWDERTWINDWPVKESVVRTGDRITFGPLTYQWRAAKADDVLANLPTTSPALPVETAVPSPIAHPVIFTRMDVPDLAPDDRTSALEVRLTELSSRERVCHERDEISVRRDREAERREQSLREWEGRLALHADKLGEDQLRLEEQEHRLKLRSDELARTADLLERQAARLETEWQTHEERVQSARQLSESVNAAAAREWDVRLRQLTDRETLLAAQEAQLSQRSVELQRQRGEEESSRQAWQQRLQSQSDALRIDQELLQADRDTADRDRARLDALQHELDARLQNLEEQTRQLAGREERLAIRESELSLQSAEFQSRQADIEARQTELRQSSETFQVDQQRALEEFSQQQTALERQLQSLNHQRETLQTDQDAWAERQDALADAEQHIGTLKRELQHGYEQLSSEQSDFAREQAAWKDTVDRQDRESQLRLQEIAGEQARLADHLAQRNSDRESLDGERQRLAEWEQALELQQGRLAEDRATFAAEQSAWNDTADKQDEYWKTRSDEVASRQTHLTEQIEKLNADQRALDGERQHFALERAAFAAEQTAWKDAAEERLAEQRAQLDTERKALEHQRQRNTDAEQELAHARAELTADREAFATQRSFGDQESAARQSQILAERAEIEAGQQRLAELSDTLNADRQGLQWERDQLAQDRLTLAEDQQRVTEEVQRLQSDREALLQQWTNLQTAQQELSQKGLQLQAEWQQLAEQRADIDECASVQAAPGEQVAERARFTELQLAWEAECAHRQEAIEAAAQALECDRQQLEELERALYDRDADLSRREQKFRAECDASAGQAVQHASADDAQPALQGEIDRLQSDLAQSLEFRQTLEQQIAGIRQRHEHDAGQWQSERLEWMLQRERLEKQLAEAARKVNRLNSQAPASDPALEIAPEIPAGDPAAATQVDSASVDEFPETDERHFAAECSDGNRGSESYSEVDESSDTANPVSNLRAQLARMFDLPEEQEHSEDVASAESNEPAADMADSIQGPEATNDWRSRLSHLESTDRTPREALSPVSAALESQAVPVAPVSSEAHEGEDSIASYMERLLARNRRGSEDPLSDTVDVTPPSRSEARMESPAGATAPAASDKLPSDTPRRKLRQKSAPDKDALREHTETLRRVANVSARVAVAKHTKKTLRVAVMIKGLVTLACGVAGVVFLLTWMAQAQPYLPQAMGCLIMAAVGAADLLRNAWTLTRAAKRLDSTSLPESPSVADIESDPATSDK